ncbi:MAG: hypothetical protein J5755_05205 [Clostridia bacterium]|nr:hypothetical protein [Clostridia bacterium]
MSNSTKKTLLLVAKIALHVLGFPLLFVLALVLNLNLIKGGISYGAAAFASLIFTAIIAVIYFLTYFLVRTKKKRSIRNQHIIIAIVVVCSMTGLWMLLDAFVPEPLETATSSTIRWEDFSDNWDARAEVNANLLKDYITLNYNLGRIPTEGKSLDAYLKEGVRNKDVADVLERDFLSIDNNGYATFVGPSIDYAQIDRMTIPVLLHLLLDKRTSTSTEGPRLIPMLYYHSGVEGDNNAYLVVRTTYKAGGVTCHYAVVDDDLNVIEDLEEVNVIIRKNGKFVAQHKSYNGEGHEEIDEKACDTQAQALAYLQDEWFVTDDYYYVDYRLVEANWDVLDMMGTPMEMQLLSADMMNMNLGDVNALLASFGTVGDLLQMDMIEDTFELVALMTSEKEVLGSPLYVGINTETGALSLTPANDRRGTLDYMRQAWLNSNGLLYIVCGFFSTRTLFYIYSPILAILALLLGLVREREAKLKADEAAAKTEEPEDKPESEEELSEEEKAAQVSELGQVDV